jgi:ABC-type uncharacterized transport system involved in gliding motility auxiliary subunit
MKQKSVISATGLLLAAALAVALIIVVNTNITGIRLDLTEGRLYTLSQGTRNILQSLDEPVRLDFYFSRKILDGYPAMINYGNRVADLLREYAARSGGMIELTIIEPEAFSEEEDQAVASGLQGVAINAAGDNAYFGLAGRNSVDDEKIIPFFQNQRQASLEYDITKLIFNLAWPDKRVIGVISDLPVFGAPALPGQPPAARPWAIIDTMREFFEVRQVRSITDDIDVLMVIHPKTLTDATLFEIDQFILGGGNAMLFVDPLAEADKTRPDPQNPAVMPDFDSDLDTLLDHWGITIPDGKVAGDINAAMRVQTPSPRGQQGVLYLPWLRLDGNHLNREDFTTNELQLIHVGSAGVIEQQESSTLQFTPLLMTGNESMLIDRDLLMFQQDPEILLHNFVSQDRQQTIAVRLSGHVQTAFPDGPPENDETTADEPAAELLTEGDINVILVADTDILSDMFWVRTQNFLGMEMHQSIANNGDFVVNALDNLSGNNDLISLRSRGEFSRPFTRVEEIRREAEEKFRAREQQLQSRLEETEQRIVALQQDSGGSSLILSPEQAGEIEKFRREMLNTRKELRAVQHELQKNIESLGTVLKFINIGLVPLLIMLASIGAALYRSRRQPLN